MFCVYWIEDSNPKNELFEASEMSLALAKCEELRTQKLNGSNINFVTLASENPNAVGKQGVDKPSPDYSWTMRRTTELRKDKKV